MKENLDAVKDIKKRPSYGSTRNKIDDSIQADKYYHIASNDDGMYENSANLNGVN